jgi:hypothetical protein
MSKSKGKNIINACIFGEALYAGAPEKLQLQGQADYTAQVQVKVRAGDGCAT